MTLQEFKRIYYMEWAHRMLGRLIGVAFVFPATYFWLKGRLRRRDKLLVVLTTAGIGFQGFLGWHMVRSGLEQSLLNNHDIPRVSQYRLAAHLGTALLLYGGLLWRGLVIVFDHHKLLLKDGLENSARFRRATLVGAGLVFLTALSGADIRFSRPLF
jgi:cytochrome c oxidase assembly protein subunit 15